MTNIISYSHLNSINTNNISRFASFYCVNFPLFVFYLIIFIKKLLIKAYLYVNKS